jgi:hypothetical protein
MSAFEKPSHDLPYTAARKMPLVAQGRLAVVTLVGHIHILDLWGRHGMHDACDEVTLCMYRVGVVTKTSALGLEGCGHAEETACDCALGDLRRF